MQGKSLVRTCLFAVMMLSISFAGVQAEDWAEPAKVEEVERGERDEAYVTWWGFDEEDSTEYMQAAIDSGVPKLTVPYQREDWVLRPIYLESDNQTVVFERGVKVKGKEGSITGRADNLFEIRDSEGVALIGHGATLRMPFVEPRARSTNLGGHLIFINASNDILVEGLTLRDGLRDGVYVGSFQAQRDYSKNVTIRDVVAGRNARQGITIASVEGMVVENSVFKNTRGKSPHSGIDAETHNLRERITDVVIRGNKFINNHSIGMHNWHDGPPNPNVPLSIVWEDNHVIGGQIGLHVGKIHKNVPGGKIVFRNNVVEETRTAGILVRNCAVEAGVQIEFVGNTLADASIGELDEWWLPKAPIVLHSRGGGRQGNIRFEDTVIQQSQPLEDRPAVKVTAREDFEGWYNVSGVIQVDAPGEVSEEIEGATDSFDLRLERKSR